MKVNPRKKVGVSKDQTERYSTGSADGLWARFRTLSPFQYGAGHSIMASYLQLIRFGMSAESAFKVKPKVPRNANAAPARVSSLLLVSFAAVYILWGSTFFAIRIGIESLPPLVMAGFRHLSVGLVFYPVFRRVSREKPTLTQWRTAIVTGVLLLLCANGTVSWAEKVIPSGIAALLAATVSLWMVSVDWLRPGGSRPAPRLLVGLALGFAGMALLVGPKHLGGERVNPLGALALVLASLAWAVGSIYSKHHPIPKSAMLGVAMQMVAGGTALLLAAGISGEFHDLHLAQVTLRSWLALGYLAVFGSALGFSAYIYILKYGTAARVATYAFVNPVVALFLGWLLGGEPLTLRTMLASAVILAAVILVITMPHKDPIEADEAIPAPGEA
jgi:drug/metabolite transporter (DMT)-like permease